MSQVELKAIHYECKIGVRKRHYPGFGCPVTDWIALRRELSMDKARNDLIVSSLGSWVAGADAVKCIVVTCHVDESERLHDDLKKRDIAVVFLRPGSIDAKQIEEAQVLIGTAHTIGQCRFSSQYRTLLTFPIAFARDVKDLYCIYHSNIDVITRKWQQYFKRIEKTSGSV